MARKLRNGIINSFCEYTDSTEIPTLFMMWSAISAVSAALGRDCFIDRGYFTVYPNLYIVLVAGSAVCKKSSAITLGTKAVRKLKPPINMLCQKLTPEWLIGALSGMIAKDNTMIVEEAVGLASARELSTLIDKNSFQSGLIPVLTDLYDCEDFDYGTRGRGIEAVRNPCLSIIGGSTLQWIKETVPKEAIGGGFTARIVFVFKESNDKMVPWPSVSEENKKKYDDIVHDLGEVAKLRGGFALTDDARNMFDAEYEDFRNNSPFVTNPNLSGYAGRRDTTLLKVCLSVSAAIDDRRVVTREDMMQGIRTLKLVEKDMPKVLQAISSELVGDVCEQVLTIIMNAKSVPRHELVRGMRHRLTVRQLDIVLETLIEERVVKIAREGHKVNYVFCG